MASERERLAQVFSAQHNELFRAQWRLEQASRLVPTVDETAWQGPARGSYERALAHLRSAIGEAIDELRTAKRETRTAIGALQQ
jgi:hypothetical protein